MTIRITGVRAQNGGSELWVSVLISNGTEEEKRSFLLTTEQYAELKPAKGEIDIAYLERLEDAAKLTKAIRKGGAILAYGINSRRALILKLRRSGFEEEFAERAAGYLEERGYLNEETDVIREAERDIAKLWGKRRVISHLRARGYGDDAIARLDALFSGTDFTENCRQVIRKRFHGVPTEPEQRKKLAAALFRYGYGMEEIRHAIEAE